MSTIVGFIPAKQFIIAALVLAVIYVLSAGYVKARPDEAIIISGLKKKSKILVGRAGMRVPFFERKDRLNLMLIPIDVKTNSSVPTADYININVDATVNVQIYNEPEYLKLAAKNFLNKEAKYIAQVAREVLEGNVREIVGQLKLKQMVSDRQLFAEKVKENAEPDLQAMGLRIISFNVQNFTDGNHVIEDLGVDNVVAISKNAAIARAESERDIKIAQAKADKESNEARVLADEQIATKQNQLDVKKSELQKEADTKKAAADSAYEIEKQRQRKTIEAVSVEADIARQEQEVLLRSKEAEVREKELDAEVRRTAEAEKYKRKQEAEAAKIEKQNEAEAAKYAVEQEAEARKLKVDADFYQKEKEAEGTRLVGEAEADAIRAKGLAEAEAMEKRAEAYAKYNEAAVTQMIIEKLPDIAKAIAEPISAIDKVTIIDGGNGTSGVEQFGGNVPAILAKTIESVKETTGFDLTKVMEANTYDAKVTKKIEYSGDPMVSNQRCNPVTLDVLQKATEREVPDNGPTEEANAVISQTESVPF